MAHLHLSRRALLTSAAASGIVLTGCTDPRITGSHTPADRPSPTPGQTPSLAHREARAAENQAAALFTACASQSLTWNAPAGFGLWCTAAAAQCLSHVQFLAGPVLLPPASTPTPAKDLATARAAIGKQLGVLSADHRQRCLASTEGDEALLWASMSVAAHSVRRQATPPVSGDTTPGPTQVGSRDQALVVLLSQVRALVYGLEVGMGVLSISSKEFASAGARLAQVLVLRDSLLEQISSTSVSPPPVELAYAMPGDLTTSATIRSTWGALENGVLAGWARLAAASPPRRRPPALDAMQQQADRVQGLGVGLTYWPGWVGSDLG